MYVVKRAKRAFLPFFCVGWSATSMFIVCDLPLCSDDTDFFVVCVLTGFAGVGASRLSTCSLKNCKKRPFSFNNIVAQNHYR